MVVADKERTALVQVSGMISRIRSLPSLALPPACPPGMPSGCTHTVNVVYRPGAGGAWVEINTAFQQVTVEIRTSEPI